MKPFTLVALAALVVSACSDATAPGADVAPLARVVEDRPTQAIPDQYIVILKDDVRDAAGVSSELLTRHGGRLRESYSHALKGFAANMTAEVAAKLASDPSVAHVEQDQIVTVDAVQSNPSWGLDRVDQRDLPLNYSYYYGSTGGGVNVYIIDTGIRRTHVDFGGRVVSAYDGVRDGWGTSDCYGHGTHVASTLGGAVYGVAKGVRLYSVRVMNCYGSATLSGMVGGIDWVTAHRVRPAVANMSLGSGVSYSIDQAVQNSINAGVTYVASAGNYGTDACTQSPAHVSAVITVAAIGSTGARASWSDYGKCVDLFAPGVSINAAYKGSDYDVRSLSGTSMAAPHVAGVAALYLAKNPYATPSQVAYALTSNSSYGKVSNAGYLSPNRLVYSGFLYSGYVSAPVARFTYWCSSRTCNFDASTSSLGAGVSGASSLHWTFGDGATASGTKVQRTYGSAGSRVVTLKITDIKGQTSSTSKTVTVP